MILGEYDFYNIAKYDINNNETYDEANFTQVHEYTHLYLSQTTTFGIITFLLNQILLNDDVDVKIKKRIKGIKETLIKNMIKVQESTAVYLEFTFIKLHNEELFEEKIKKIKNTEYFNRYDFKRLIDFLGIENQDDVIKTILQLAKISLSIDISFFDILSKDLNNLIIRSDLVNQYNPNVRFKNLIRIIKKEISDGNINFDVKDILEKANINYFDLNNIRNIETLKNWINEFLTKLELNDMEKYITFEIAEGSENDIDIAKTIYPVSLELKYELKNANSLNELVQIEMFNILYIIEKQDEIYSVMLINVNDGIGNVVFSTKDDIKDVLEKRNYLILIDKFYYDSVLKEIPEIVLHKIFINLNGTIHEHSNFININKSINNEIMMYDINENSYCLFIKGKIDSVAMISFVPKSMLDTYMQFIKKSKYINYKNCTDNVFWYKEEDCWDYEDILYFLIQKTWKEDDNVYLGQRINLQV